MWWPSSPGKLAEWLRGQMGEKTESAKRRAADAKTKALLYRDQVVGTRHRLAPIDIAIRAYERDRDTGGGVLAAAIAFRLFLFMVPYVFAVFTVFGLGAKVAGESPERVAQIGGISGILGQAISSAGEISTSSQVLILITALWALFTTARSVMKVLTAAHRLIWRVEIRKTLRASAPLVFIGVMLVTSALSVGLARIRDAQPTVGVGLTLLSLVIPLLVWWRVSLKFLHDDAPDWALLPGAAMVSLGMQGLHLFTVFYIAGQVSGQSETYGFVGAALSVLFWAYLMGRLIVGSIVLNATLWNRYKEQALLAEGLPVEPVPVLVKGPGPLAAFRSQVSEVRKLLQ